MGLLTPKYPASDTTKATTAKPPTPARTTRADRRTAAAAHKAAVLDLRDNRAAEKANGITTQTSTTTALQDRVTETAKHVPWWRR